MSTSPLAHRTDLRLSDGLFYPLGATLGPDGVNFAVYSREAEKVFLLLFDDPVAPPTQVIEIPNRTRFVWHVFVHGVGPGQFYGYRVQGPCVPQKGLRFNEHKLLIDPYARALSHKAVNRDNLLLAYDPHSPDRDLSLDLRDNSAVVPKAIVIDPAFDWQSDCHPQIPLEKLLIYEVHLKGFTAHPSSGVQNPGTYLGFIEKIPHLVALGINAVELLPIHERLDDDFLRDRGLVNYWGYNTLGFFAPEQSYAAGRQPGAAVQEFKTLVRALHAAGIEVILDVVYNHTCEGSELGPTLSFRGFDNRSYYALAGTDNAQGRYYMNPTGCGNSLDLSQPAVLRLVLDSLRHWVLEMHVDGFRFDLASVLGREDGAFRSSSSFFDAVNQDPVLCRTKLIAEPWDLGTYQVGNFPVDWSEWNGKFRDTARRFAKGDAGQLADLGYRLTGSADLYGDDGRSPYNSINFVTCHDGFTLADLVTFNNKHNDANGEANRDGTDDNNSWNCGVEGETGDAGILRLRLTQAKNLLTLLFLASGTPMLLGGDEFFRSQRGNNNAYCQDNDISWFDWTQLDKQRGLFDFCRRLIALRRRFPGLSRRRFWSQIDLDQDGVPEISWFGPSLAQPAWNNPEAQTLCCQLDIDQEDQHCGAERMLMVFHAGWQGIDILLPPLTGAVRWHRVIDTSLPAGNDFREEGQEEVLAPGLPYQMAPRSTLLLLARPTAR